MVEATQGVEHTGAMIALLPSDASCDHMHVEGGESPDELHLTLFYLGDAADYDDEKRQEIVNAIESMVKTRELPTVKARTFGVNHWNTDGDEPSVVLAVGDVEEGEDLAEIREAINTVLTSGMVILASGVLPDIPEQHTPWVPHVCLAYTDDTDMPATLGDRVGCEIEFDHIRVAFGGLQWDIPFNDALTAAGEFEEHEHPRGKGGKFVKKGAGGGGKAFAPTKAIYGKPVDQEIVAVAGEEHLRWNATDKKFDLEHESGGLLKQLTKTEAYKLVKQPGWSAPAPKTPPKIGTSKAPAGLKPHPIIDEIKKLQTPAKSKAKFAPTKIAYGKHENGAVVAELVDGSDGQVMGRMVWNGDVKKFVTQVHTPDGTWKNVSFITKGQAYEKLKTITPPNNWQVPKNGPVVGEKIVTQPTPVPPKPVKHVPLLGQDVASLTDSIVSPPSTLTAPHALFDTAWAQAKKHKTSLAAVMNTYDSMLGYNVKENELGPKSMMLHQWLQTKEGAAIADDYINDFGEKSSILGFKKDGTYGTAAPTYKPPTTSTFKPTSSADVEAGKPAPNARQSAEMINLQKNTPPPWTTSEQNAMRAYSSTAYIDMNMCLRGKGTCGPTTKGRINAGKKAMRPLGLPVTAYRGVGFEMFGLPHGDIAALQSFEGKVVSDPGFVSTSIDVTRKFAKPITMTVHVPEGASAAYIEHISHHPSEKELILAPGTKFKVRKVNPPNPPKFVNSHVELEVIV